MVDIVQNLFRVAATYNASRNRLYLDIKITNPGDDRDSVGAKHQSTFFIEL
jgi:hypothetical protein